MIYAVVELGGKQLWVESGKFYDVDKLQACPGETLILNKVLLLKKNKKVILGNPCIKNCTVVAKVLKHFKSRKITVFKMQQKKNKRSKRGYRQNVTRLFIENI